MISERRVTMTKLESAKLLILGMESLQASGLIPVSSAAVAAAGSPAAAAEQQRLAMALSCAVLYPIVVELVVKHIWEQETGQTARFRHDIYSLFGQLKPETRSGMETLYDRCCREYRTAIGVGQQQIGAENVAVNMANLEEALRWNEDAVKNLKYELTPRGQSVPTGIFWSVDTMWVAPGKFPNFAIELTRWATNRTFTPV